jgi:uncharacterized membrane protein YedE/YeeE
MDAVCLAFGMPSMSDLATRAFWLSLVLAAVIGFGAEIGLLRWCAIGWLGLIGCLFSLLNWAYLVIQVRNGGNGSSCIGRHPLSCVATLDADRAPAGPDSCNLFHRGCRRVDPSKTQPQV